ncbi:hypothetical protein ACRAWF_03810 [Streptomyces sp. L7]
MSVETMRTVAPRPGTTRRRVRVERTAPVALRLRDRATVEEVHRRPAHTPPLHSAAVSGDRIGVIVAAPRPGTDHARSARRVLRAILTRVNSPRGTHPLRLGRRPRHPRRPPCGAWAPASSWTDWSRIDVPTLLIGLGIGVVTTVFSAWRWALVARGHAHQAAARPGRRRLLPRPVPQRGPARRHPRRRPPRGTPPDRAPATWAAPSAPSSSNASPARSPSPSSGWRSCWAWTPR